MSQASASQDVSPSGITLCGCGWLGKHFARSASSMKILGTTRSENNVPELRDLGVSPFLYALGDDPLELATQSGNNAVILNIPPGRRKTLDESFVTNMKQLMSSLLNAGASKLIFISTTSVFGDAEGELDTTAAVSPVTDSGKAHCELEKFLIEMERPNIHVLRLSGLVGPDRHPAKYLAGKERNKGEQAVNLVHIDDVVSALQAILACGSNQPGALMQLCAINHPRRDEYYTWACEKLGLEAPVFTANGSKGTGGKKILSEMYWNMLGLNPKFPSPYDML